MGGQVTPFDLGGMLRKRLSIRGFTLRAQSIENKRAIVGALPRALAPAPRRRIDPADHP